MGEVQDSLVFQFLIHARHEEGHSRLAEGVQNGGYRGVIFTGDRRQLRQPCGPADAAVIGTFLGKRLEQPLARLAMPVVRERVVDFVGMIGKGGRQPTRRFKIAKINGASVVAAGKPDFPHPHQGVLKHRQLIRVVTDVVQQALDEHGRDFRAADADRFFDRVPLLVAQQAGNQVFPRVDRFRQPRNLGAVPQIVGTHRDSHVDRAFRLLASG